MPAGALMAARQFLGQYLIYARPWQRALIAAGAVGGGALMIAAGIATGHVVLAVAGGVPVLLTVRIGVQVIRARRRGAREGPGAGRTDRSA